MSNHPGAAEEKIIQATIACIERYGITATTNRQIARAAGVNIAAINYYFRSKQALIRRCMEITLNNAFDLGDMPAMPGASPQERCTAIFDELLAGGLRYPGITRAHFYPLLVEGRYDPLLAEHIQRFISNLAADLQGRGCNLPPHELRLALTQIFSAVALAILAPQMVAQASAVHLEDTAARRGWVERLVNRLLAAGQA